MQNSKATTKTTTKSEQRVTILKEYTAHFIKLYKRMIVFF